MKFTPYLVVVILLTFVAQFVCADSLTFNSAATFNPGSYYNITYNSNDLLNITRNNETGVYQSAVTDAGQTSIWSTMTWKFERCYACELPSNQAVETGYTTNVNMSDNLVYFKFNETALDTLADGNDTLDSSGNGWNGYVNGSTTDHGKTGLFGKAINFTANSNKVAVTNFPYIQNFTVSAWIKLNSTSATDRYMTVVSRGNYESNNLNYLLGIRRRNIGNSDGWWAIIAYRNGATAYGLSSETLLYNEGADAQMYNWHHLAATFTSSTKNLTLYFDGVPIDSSIQASNPGNAANLNLTIGSDYTPNAFKYFSGLIDEVAIWNRTLSAAEMKSLYYRGAYNVTMQIKSCSTSNCADTAAYAQTIDASSGQTAALSLPNNRYLQFNTTLTRLSNSPAFTTSNYSPVWYNVTFGYATGNSFYNLPSGFTAADPDTDTSLTPGEVFTVRKQLNLKYSGSRVADIWTDLDVGDADLSRLIVDSKNTNSEKKAVMDWRNVIAGDNLDQADHALYTDATWANGAYVCPTAYTTDDVSTSCAGKVSFTHAECQSGTTTSGITCTIVSGQYKLAGLSGTGIAANGNTQMTINDSAEGSNVATNTAATFYAYYHTNPGDAHIAGATCQIEFDDNPGVWNAMTEDAGNGRYTYTKAAGFATAATHTWQVDCVKATYTQLTTSDTIQVGTAQTGSIPFFEDLTLLLALILAGLGATRLTSKENN